MVLSLELSGLREGAAERSPAGAGTAEARDYQSFRRNPSIRT